MPDLEWKQEQFGVECRICDLFRLRVREIHAAGHQWEAMVLGPSGCGAFYASRRTFDFEGAKKEAVKQGIRVAIRESRRYASIAEVLKKHA